MHRYLLAGTALASLAVPLAAQTLVEDARTQPIRTSELQNGAGDAVTVTEDGSIKPSGGAAITMDSDHDVTNDGAITVTNADGASGIETLGDRQADIVNSGTIVVDETYAPSDIDNDSDLDGPFATGSGRAGIRLGGNLVGDVRHSGTITVEGNQSAGILLGGSLQGDLVHDGKTGVTGDDAIGVDAGDITGDVRLAGTIAAVGQDAVGARLRGDIGGALVVQGEIVATGYRYPTPPTDRSKLDDDDLLQGGSALVIEGDVADGIIFAVAPANADEDNADEDNDGIADAEEGAAKVVSYGAAPAVVIGAEDRDIAIGAVPASGSDFGLIVDGSIAGAGTYAGIDGNGLVIGGRGGAVTIENGIAIGGTVTASSLDADATALRLGAGATTGELRNAGTIAAANGAAGSGTATAVAIDAGASLPYLRNSGTIKATAGNEEAGAVAIVDGSGTLKLVENSGAIVASGAEADSDRNVAIDLTAVTTGATVRQTQVGAGIDAPSIAGDIRFGSGNDVLDIADGTVTGNVRFGTGEDRLAMSGDALFSGQVEYGAAGGEMALSNAAVFSGQTDFAGGAGSLTLSDKAVYTGRLIGSDNLAVTVGGGTLDLAVPTTIASLDVGESGVLVATLASDPAEGSALTVGGTASFAEGAKLRLRVTDIARAEGTYTVIEAGTLSGASDLTTEDTLVPFMYQAALEVNESAGIISVEIARKATEDLELNRAQATAYDALYAALGDDEDIAGVFLGITDKNLFAATLAQALPDHAGGAFEGVSLGVRTFARRLAQGDGPMDRSGKLRFVFDAAGWDSTKDQQDAAGYDLDGLGFSGGLELATGVGRFGATASWMWNRYEAMAENTVSSSTYEGAVYWRGDWGAFSGFARGSYGISDFQGSRYFRGRNGSETLARRIEREWSGNVASFVAGASVEAGGQYFFMRPSVMVDYVRLSEDGYAETGGGDALALVIEDRTSDELGLSLGSAAGFDLFGMGQGDEFWMRVEVEGGWREILSGDLGATTARIGDGESFTLLPDQHSSGWFARLRGQGGDEFYTVSGEFSLEERNSEIGYALRASVDFAL